MERYVFMRDFRNEEDVNWGYYFFLFLKRSAKSWIMRRNGPTGIALTGTISSRRNLLSLVLNSLLVILPRLSSATT